MKKYEIIKKNIQFNDIINNGKYLKNKFYIIYFLPSDNNYSKFGLAVSKKCGNAVQRNKIKRQLRTIIDNNKQLFFVNNYIIMVRKQITDISYKEMNDNFVNLLERIRL